jgi:predicted aspartyl protease
MGVFRVDAEVAGIATPEGFVAVEKLVVDTGSEFTWLPASLLEEAGVTVAKESESFLMADGKTVNRPTGYAILRSCGFETVDEVVYARPDDLTLLGAHTLEGFRAVVDPGRKRLVAAGPHLAAPGGGFNGSASGSSAA